MASEVAAPAAAVAKAVRADAAATAAAFQRRGRCRRDPTGRT